MVVICELSACAEEKLGWDWSSVFKILEMDIRFSFRIKQIEIVFTIHCNQSALNEITQSRVRKIYFSNLKIILTFRGYLIVKQGDIFEIYCMEDMLPPMDPIIRRRHKVTKPLIVLVGILLFSVPIYYIGTHIYLLR